MKILLTLDYELFNGRKCGTVENCLIKPMEALCTVLDKYNYKATLFVDTVFINRLKQLSCDYPELLSEYNKIIEQLRHLHQNGYDLQLHIHPNWLHASYNEGCWHSKLTDFKLSDMTDDEVDQMFSEGVSLIESITGEKGGVIAYRAGAYCIQTYPRFKEVFKRFGIKVDSSVFRYQKSVSETYQNYDYRNLPEEYCYRIENDVTKKNVNGSFWEVSIPTYIIKNQDKRDQRKLTIKEGKEIKRWGDGVPGLTALEKPWKKMWLLILSRLKSQRVAASIDSTSGYFLETLYRQDNKDYFLIMCHPKNLTSYSIRCFDAFLMGVDKNDRMFTISQLFYSLNNDL